MPTISAPVINLADYRRPMPSVDLGSGGVHVVQALNGTILELLEEAKKPGQAALLWRAAVACLPTAPPDVVLALTSAEVDTVLAIASFGEVPPA